jgi:hypothetical protein
MMVLMNKAQIISLLFTSRKLWKNVSFGVVVRRPGLTGRYRVGMGSQQTDHLHHHRIAIFGKTS